MRRKLKKFIPTLIDFLRDDANAMDLMPEMHSAPINQCRHCTKNWICSCLPVWQIWSKFDFEPIANMLRWFETVFHSPFQLNFMKGLLICSKRLLLLVDSRCYNDLSIYQLLYSHWHFGCHGNLTGPQIHPISSIQPHFTQKVVGELLFLLHQNCLHIKAQFLRKLKKILSRDFGATLIFCNIKVAPKPLDRIFLNFLKKCSLMC